MSVYSQVSSYSDYVDLQHYTGSAGDTGAGPEMSGAFWLSGSTATETTFFFNSGIETAGSITGETSLTIGNVVLVEAELDYLNGITIGTAGASKALVLDAEKFIDGIEQLTASIMSASSIFCTDLTVHDATLTIGSTSISEDEAGFIDGVVAGTAAASKAVVLDGSKNIATIGTIGCGAITSTGASTFGSVSGSTTVSGRSFTADTGGTIGCAADTDLMTLTANTLTVAGATNSTTVSGSGQLSGMKLVVDTGGTIGLAADTDLLTLTANTLTVAGAANATSLSASAGVSGGTGSFGTTVTAGTTMSASQGISARSLTVDTGLTIGCAADTDLLTLTANTLTIAGATNSTTVSGSGRVAGQGLMIDNGGTVGIVADADLMTLTANTLTVAGAANATTVSGSGAVSGGSFAGGTFVTAGTTMSASQGISARSITVDTGLTIGCAADTDLLTLAANTLTVAGTVNASTAMSASTTVKGRSFTADTGGTIGCAADTDLMTLAANTLTVAGTVNVGTALSASTTLSGRSLTVDNGLTIGCAADTDLMTLSNGNVTFTGTTVIGTADVNGGAIDAVTIGTNSAATRLVVQGAGAQSVKSTGANHITLSAGQGESANVAANLVFNAANLMSFDAQGTDDGDGFSFTLGTDNADTAFSILNNSGTELAFYDGSGIFEHNDGQQAAADFILNGTGSVNHNIAYEPDLNSLILYQSGTETARFGGDAATDYAVDVKDGSSAKNKIRAAAFVTYSDERLKTDVVEMNNALKTVNSIKAVNFTWKKDGSQDFGFLAQDLKKVIPQAVHGNDDGLLGVDYGRLTSVLVKAIQEQSVQIKALQEKLDK